LLATMFNTGARVQEIVTLCVRDLQLEALPQVRLYGKGRKERWCPLWPQTTEILRAWLEEPGRDVSPDRPLFCNHRRERLTRFGRGVKNRLDGHKFAKLPHKTTVFVRTACRSSPHCFGCLRALPICLPRSL
jgi:site-specific recombinase XerD